MWGLSESNTNTQTLPNEQLQVHGYSHTSGSCGQVVSLRLRPATGRRDQAGAALRATPAAVLPPPVARACTGADSLCQTERPTGTIGSSRCWPAMQCLWVCIPAEPPAPQSSTHAQSRSGSEGHLRKTKQQSPDLDSIAQHPVPHREAAIAAGTSPCGRSRR